MTRAISLSKLLDEAGYLEDSKTKGLAGSITDAENFDRNRKALQSMHKGLFSFLAFHPGTDKAVSEYVEEGSIASDAGTAILVLFFATTEIRSPRSVSSRDLNLG